jgi:hypothetical protein
VKQNPDGSYDVNGAMAVRDDYVANDPRFDTHLETRGGTQSGGSSGGGDEQAGDRSDDFAAMASGDAFNYWVAQAQGRQPLGGTTDPRYWNPNDIRAGVQEHVDRYNDAVANGDHAAQADSLNDLRVFIRAVNPRLSDDAATARAFAFAGGNVDRANYSRDENGRIVIASTAAVEESDASDDAWLDRINNAPGLTLTPEQLTERLREVDEGLGRDIRVAELQEASLGGGELVPVGGGTNNARPPVQPVLNGNWDAALNLAADPVGLLAPWQGTREAMSQLSAANAESQIETRRRALIELGVPNVPLGYEENIGADGRITRDYGRTAALLTSTYERFVEDQRLRATWGDNYRDVRIGNSNMTVQEFERMMLTRQQQSVDDAYDRGRILIAQGKLPLEQGNYNLTLGNYIDRETRRDMRTYAASENINDSSVSQFAAINRRLAGRNGYGVPDLRLGNSLYVDVTLANKTPYSQQIRNWNDIRPATSVIIIKPSQLGGSQVIPGAAIPKPRPRGS